MSRSLVTALVCKTDCPPTAVRQLEARTPDGRYAASRSNELTLVRVRPRRNPTSALLAVNHGQRSMPGPMHKAVGPRVIDGIYRAQQGAKRFGAGYKSMRVGMFNAAHQVSFDRAVNSDRAGLAGAMAATAAPSALVAAGAHRLGRRKGRKDTAAALAPMAKSYRGNVFGKSADVVQVGHWHKPNPRIPDGARRGRRLPID